MFFQRRRTLWRADLWRRRDIDFSPRIALVLTYILRSLCLSNVTLPPRSFCWIYTLTTARRSVATTSYWFSFDLQGRLRCKLSYRRTCLCATCHKISYVLSRTPCLHTNVSTTRRVHLRVCALKDACVHTFFGLTKSCLRITFNIWHHVCQHISNRRSRNNVQPHDLTYEPFSVSNFPHTKSCLRTLLSPTRRTVMRVHCEKTYLCATFWLAWMCSHENFLMRARVCIQLVT